MVQKHAWSIKNYGYVGDVSSGSVMGIRLATCFFSKTREMTCGWDVECDERKTNGVSLDVGWKMSYRVIQWLDGYAQLARWLAHYFAIIYTLSILKYMIF
jgi:hypothetical protein